MLKRGSVCKVFCLYCVLKGICVYCVLVLCAQKGICVQRFMLVRKFSRNGRCLLLHDLTRYIRRALWMNVLLCYFGHPHRSKGGQSRHTHPHTHTLLRTNLQTHRYTESNTCHFLPLACTITTPAVIMTPFEITFAYVAQILPQLE